MNPYASPAEPSTADSRFPLALSLLLVANLFVVFLAAARVWGGADVFLLGDSVTSVKMLLFDSAVVAFLGIVTFRWLGRKWSRAICLSQFIVTASMLPMLLRLHWYIHDTYMLHTLVAFACIDLLLLHFALRRFETSGRLACGTLTLMTIVDMGIIIVTWMFLDPYADLPGVVGVLRVVGVQLGEGAVCVLLVIRVLKIHSSGHSAEGDHSHDATEK